MFCSIRVLCRDIPIPFPHSCTFGSPMVFHSRPGSLSNRAWSRSEAEIQPGPHRSSPASEQRRGAFSWFICPDGAPVSNSLKGTVCVGRGRADIPWGSSLDEGTSLPASPTWDVLLDPSGLGRVCQAPLPLLEAQPSVQDAIVPVSRALVRCIVALLSLRSSKPRYARKSVTRCQIASKPQSRRAVVKPCILC